jgi:hypothetical protein
MQPMAITITLIVVALAAGFIGTVIERRRSSSITKREATQLRRDIEEMRFFFGEHWDTHKIIKYHIDKHTRDIDMIASAVGFKRANKLDG